MTDNLVTGTRKSLEVVSSAPQGDKLIKKFLREPAAVISLVFLALLVVVAVLAPLISSYDPTATRLADVLAPPFTAEHPLGADGVGRDVLANLVYGAQTSLSSAAIVIAVSLLIGVPTGLLAGYRQGWIDGVSMWISGALLSLPAIVVLLVVLARVGRSTSLALVVFGILIAPSVFLLIRGSVRAVREELYVDAARVSGLSDIRIMVRHILPVVITPTIIQAALLAGAGIGIEAGIAFLGLGSSDKASWGLMLNDASQNIFNAPGLLIWPSAALVLTVMACTLVGNGFRDALANYGSSAGPARKVKAAEHASSTPEPARPMKKAPVDPGDALLVIDDLRVSYPRPNGEKSDVVKGISLRVERGQIVGLVGESGSGKSQTAFSVLGLLPGQAHMTAGTLSFAGVDLLGMTPKERNGLRGARIGYIPQEPMSNLDPAFRIGSQLTEPMRHHLGISAKTAKEEALKLLARVGIPDPERVFKSYPHQVSGGMAQRVLIAGAVSCNPELLIADEPTTALDVTVQADVLDLIRSLQAERGMGVVLVTHNFGVVADLCDQVAVMRNGEIVEVAEVTELFTNPREEYTRLLLDSALDSTSKTPADHPVEADMTTETEGAR
ncbi:MULTISPECIES: dipeptide/oligopeptide/nickel ABC transporter permease/ATP-binding protein [Micrococcaceae]|uniref:Peptide/nickel transport system permease protein n=1 Tax=Pseudarthrobacter equi TaxID=728066 RepID=A0A1H1YKG2_9MICC|nr:MULTISPECIES: dipeptide/oligopeptide/nickel ABC transporter permease/ATP-binding protein [Micrococcaceae]KQQ85106.1 ABC transporter [Arthrobacter sp. Leaf137]MCT9626347.1 dipeptide/oligopeptide/nickel ABC transporter permease/ATP-binding protein [Pseudarthrobacter equi]MDQ1052170.1 peptide/nickel transport system permease protein [Arthrobacter sp. SORGH_AS_0212]SDT21874.1 peptide/nickel transport system permease protein [Pseudarthrobacter equi]